ncbi:hypothetical protein Tco_0570675 [Tanacetum coccineum]
MPYSEQTHINDYPDNEIISDSNIIPYSQYMQESQDAGIQDTNSSAPNDLLVLSLVEQMTDHVANLDNKNQTNKMVNESLTVELERYKEHDTHKQALAYQNPFNLKKAQRIKPTLYDGSVIAKEHAVISVIDDEETFILEEESRSKMRDKQKDTISIKQKINISPIDYSKLNKIKEDFGKRFVTQKELSAEQAFWLKHSNYNPDTSVKSHTPVRVEAPSELPKVSLLNERLKKLKYQLASFDKVVKKRTTSDAITADKNAFKIQIKQLRIDNDQLLKQIMSQEIVHIVVNSVDILNVNKSCVDECNKCLELEIGFLKKKDLIEKDVYDKLLKKINELKAQSHEKDTVIKKLKDRIKSLKGKYSVENVKKDIDEIETINIDLEHSVAKLLSENENLRKEREHLKSIYKDQFDLIKKTRVQSNKHCASLIAQINEKSVANLDLNTQLQEKVFAIAALKNELRKLKGKNIVDTVVSKPSATIAPGMFKLDIEPISHRLENNRDAHEVYLEKTKENTDTLCRLVECARKHNPGEPLLESACMLTKHVQELLVYVSKTCPSLTKPIEKLVNVTPMNKDKKVRFAEPVTSSRNIPTQTDSLKTKDSNKPLLTFTGVKSTTNASGSKPSGNTKNNRITRPPSSKQKNKVEEHPRKHKSSLNKMNSVSKPISNAHVKHSVRNAKFESICAIYKKRLFDANRDRCIIDYVNDVNVRSKSKSKRNKMRKVCIPTRKVFIKIGYSWKPTCRTFTILENKCPLTRITSTNEVPLKETIVTPIITQSPALKVYSSKPKASRSVGSSSKAKIVKSKTSNTKEPKQSWGSTVFDVPSSSLIDCRFGNDHIAKIIGYGEYQMGNVTISRVSYVEGLGHNLFSVGQFCDSDLEVAFSKHTCFIRDLEGVDLLEGSRGLIMALNSSIRLRAYYEEVKISHQTFVARTLQQNGVVERRNLALVEAVAQC